MGRLYAVFISLFPLLTGIALVSLALSEESPRIALSPDVSISRDLVTGIGGVFIGAALLMIIFSRRVERGLYAFVNLFLPPSMRTRPEELDREEARARESRQAEEAAGQAAVLDSGRDFVLSSDYRLTIHNYPARFGVLTGILLLLPLVAHELASFGGVRLPDLEVLLFFLFIVGLAVLGKRGEIRLDRKSGLLEDRRKLWWYRYTKVEPLEKFDRVIMKRRRLLGFGGADRTRDPEGGGFGVIFLVQLGGSGQRTLGFYSRYEDARRLAMAATEVTGLTLREVLD